MCLLDVFMLVVSTLISTLNSFCKNTSDAVYNHRASDDGHVVMKMWCVFQYKSVVLKCLCSNGYVLLMDRNK